MCLLFCVICCRAKYTFAKIIDLRLRNCQPSNVWDFSLLSSLNKLTALDLYSASIIDEALIVILRSNLELKHLILGN